MISWLPIRQAPTAVITGPSEVPFGEPFELSGELSTDTGGGVVQRYIWTPLGEDFGPFYNNRRIEFDLHPILALSDLLATQDITLPVGSHIIQLEVRDDSGNTSQPVLHEVTVVP